VNLADRFRAALGRRPAPAVLVRVGPPRALPTPRIEMRALPAPPRQDPVCPRCGERHPRLPQYPAGYGTVILPRRDRPAPAGRGDERALERDRFTPWRL
jgi:hypothetical protein